MGFPDEPGVPYEEPEPVTVPEHWPEPVPAPAPAEPVKQPETVPS